MRTFLAPEIQRVAENMGLQYAAIERVEAFQIWRVGSRKVAIGGNGVIELLRRNYVLDAVMGGDEEFLFLLVPGDHAHRRVEADPFDHR